jgi:hypothetical protein
MGGKISCQIVVGRVGAEMGIVTLKINANFVISVKILKK